MILVYIYYPWHFWIFWLSGSTVAQWWSAWLNTEGLLVWASPASLHCCPWARHIYTSLVLVQPRKTGPCLTERLLMGRTESNQTNKFVFQQWTIHMKKQALYGFIKKLSNLKMSSAVDFSWCIKGYILFVWNSTCFMFSKDKVFKWPKVIIPAIPLLYSWLCFYQTLTLYLIEKPFDTFASRADPDQAALISAAWSGSTLFAYGNIRYDPTLVDLTSNFFVLCTNVKVNIYNYS